MNLELLKAKIEEINIPITTIAEKMGVSRQSLYLKIKGVRDFKASEMYCISDILRLTDDEKALIFFGCKLPNTSTNLKGEKKLCQGRKRLKE